MFWTTCVDRVCVCPWSKVLSDAAPKPQLAPGPVCKCAQSFLGLGRKCKMIQFSQFIDIWRRNAREHGCKMIKMSGLRMWIAVDWNLESQCDGHNASQHQTTNAVCNDVNIKRKDQTAFAKNSLCDMQTERSASMFLHFPGHWEQRREFPESWERVEPGSECVGSNMINEYQWSIIYNNLYKNYKIPVPISSTQLDPSPIWMAFLLCRDMIVGTLEHVNITRTSNESKGPWQERIWMRLVESSFSLQKIVRLEVPWISQDGLPSLFLVFLSWHLLHTKSDGYGR